MSLRTGSSPKASVNIRKGRCGACKGCLSPNCGKCNYCKDKISFGGENLVKKACVQRKCTMQAKTMVSITSLSTPVVKNNYKSNTSPASKGQKLPRIMLESMTKSDLKTFVPEMLKLVTGRDEVWHSRRSVKPAWWPDNVKWATSTKNWQLEKHLLNSLQSVVRSCYKYMGHEDQLTQPDKTTNRPDPNTTRPVSSASAQTAGLTVRTEQEPISPLKTSTFPKGLLFPFSAEIYICFFCEKEFLNKQKMRLHQKQCSERPPELKQYQAIATVSQECLHKDPPPMSPKQPLRPKYSSLPLKQFCGHLDLVPKSTAAKLRASRASLEIDCNLEETEPTSPFTPVTPRTPKSLISQLSRDDSGGQARKRLSYSLSVDKDHADDVGQQSSDSEDEQGDKGKPDNKESNLLAIPVSSLLGQRIKNNIHVESPVSVVDNKDVFCRTPVKNSFLEKLRKKASSYPVVYRPRRVANLHKQNHLYKFSRLQTREFLCKIKTGLNLSSYKKLKQMKRAKVVVAKMTRQELLRWEPAYVLDRMLLGKYNRQSKTLPHIIGVRRTCAFPLGPTLLSPNIDKLLGLKKKSAQQPKSPVNTPLSIGNFVSEELEEEISKQKLTLYRSLLYEMSVTKPTVVIENMSDFNKPNESPAQMKNLSKSKVLLNGSDKYNVLAEQKNSTSEKLKAASSKPLSGYNTLRSLLTPQQVSPVKKLKTGDQPSENLEKKVLEPPSTDRVSPSVVSATVCNVSGRQLSPGDDVVSVMSLSSEGEIFNPSCCMSCRSKTPVSSSQCGVESCADESPLPRNATMPNTRDVLKPLNVLVDEETCKPLSVQCQSEVLYGIPSPVSTRSESPLPPTFTNRASTPNILVSIPDPNLSPCVKTSVEQFSKLDTPRSHRSHKHQNASTGKIVENDSMDSPIVSSRLQSLRSTMRSKSLTPMSSPYKQETPINGSLPNSSTKSLSTRQGAVKAVSMSSVKRMLLCETMGKMDTRSTSKDLTNSSHKPLFSKKSGNVDLGVKNSSGPLERKRNNLYFRKTRSLERRDLRSRGVKRKASTQNSDILY